MMGEERLNVLRRRWRAESIGYCLLLALAVSILLTTAAHIGLGWPLWAGVLLFGACFGIALMLFPLWRMGLADIAAYLDRRLPELEESCGLLLRRDEQLGSLERLQVERMKKRWDGMVMPKPLQPRLLRAALLTGVAIVASIVVGWLGGAAPGASGRMIPAGAAGASGRMRPQAPGIRAVNVRITPPAYTGRAMRSQEGFALEVEEGAQLRWELATTKAVDTVSFVFNDTAVMLLQPMDSGRTRWSLSGAALHAGFYQVNIGGQLSGLYTFELIPDDAPTISVRAPRPFTTVDYGEPLKVGLRVQLQDDYGIADASVIATVSSGKGEAVKFKEQELRWDRNFPGGTHYDLSRVLDLEALGMRAGDELYFYCKARDNHGQESRTDMYIISLADTAQLMSLEGMTVGTDVKPEFFRSERQIIIETEQLLKEKDGLPLSAFNTRSNDLGIDQKLLRLRYGKFLGEEAEEGEPGGAEGDTPSFGAFGDAAKILDAYTDKHDNAEDATFFEPGTKAQLKATLSEMWSAELRLRTFKPREALPYCYKALRLLKDLQQQSRVYVAKTGVRLTPLNPAKRLTGELTAIAPPGQKVGRAVGLSEEEVLRIGLGVLEEMQSGLSPGDGDRVVLQQVTRVLGREASARPGKFLEGYEAMKRLEKPGDVLAAERAMVALLPAAAAGPVARKDAADGGLGRLYFSYLK